MNLKNLVANTIGMGGFIVLNKALVFHFDELETPCVLGYMIDKWRYFDFEDFYYKVSDLMEDSRLSERKIQSSVKKLIQEGILVKKAFKGIPAKQYYNIDIKKIIEVLNIEIPSPCKNEGDSCYNTKKEFKNDDSSCSTFEGAIYRNNTIRNNKEDFSNEKSPPYIPPLVDNQKIAMEKPTLQTASKDKTKNADALLAKKPKTKKELLDYAIAIYKQTKEANPKLALTFKAWSDWVEYKLLKESKITYKTFELNLKKLVEYGDDANKIIEQSIGNNWSGLFDLRKFEKKSDVDIYSQMVNDLSDKPDDWRKFEEYEL